VAGLLAHFGVLNINAIGSVVGLYLSGGNTILYGDVYISVTPFHGAWGTGFFISGGDCLLEGNMVLQVSGIAQGLYFGSGNMTQRGVINVTVEGNSGYFENAFGKLALMLLVKGIIIKSNASGWNQYGPTNVLVLSSDSTGILFHAGQWNQYGPTNVLVWSFGSSGVQITSPTEVHWAQLGGLGLAIIGNNSCGINFGNNGFSMWNQVGKVSYSVTSQSSNGLCPSPLPSPSFPSIQYSFNETNPSVTIKPSKSDTRIDAFQFEFIGLSEVSPDKSITKQTSLQKAGWQKYLSGNGVNSFISYSNNTESSVIYTFSSFTVSQTITLGNNYTLQEDPQYLKLTVQFQSWNWSSMLNSLEIEIAVTPPFNNSVTRENTPQFQMTTLLLSSGKSAALIRLLTFGLDQTNQPIYCSISTRDSSVILTFGYFGPYLSYDPDLSLLLSAKSSNSSTPMKLIDILIEVITPIAVVLTISIIALIVLLQKLYRYKSRKLYMTKLRNFAIIE